MPVCHGRGCQLKCLDTLCAHQVRSCTQIHKFSLTVEGNFLPLRQCLNQFYLVRLILFLHQLNGFFSGKRKLLQLFSLFDDFLHFCFQFIQIFSGKRNMVKIIVKACVNTGPDCQLCIREQSLYCLCQHMGCGMADGCKSLCICCGTNLQLAVLIQYSTQIHNFSVYLAAAGCSCQSFA